MDACLGNGMGWGVLGGFGLTILHRVVRPKRSVSFLGALGTLSFSGSFTMGTVTVKAAGASQMGERLLPVSTGENGFNWMHVLTFCVC